MEDWIQSLYRVSYHRDYNLAVVELIGLGPVEVDKGDVFARWKAYL